MKEKQKEKRSESQSNILVAIRIRPLNPKEIANSDMDIVRTQDNLIIILDPVQAQYELDNKKMLDVLHRSKQQRYAFDKIYPNQASQLIYQETTQSLVKTVISGKNATVFAYGPTGTGKTYTMLGNQQVYGLNVLAIRDIFRLIEVDSQYNYKINITYVQIYNQMIRDLLVPASGYLELRDDNEKGVSIAGVTEFAAQSTQQVMELLLIGNKRRTTQATNANQTSSRSHAVFQINVIKTPRTRNINVETLTGKLSLIDLAGSERGTVTQNRGIRLMEGAKINRSLLALANCINALGDKNKKGFFVPYRDSKLTRLLKDSLGGNSKTVMIANISPAGSQFQQTINTLKYANRAKNIKTKPLTNKKLVSIHISEYKNIIKDLRQEIQQLKLKLQRNEPLNSIEANFQREKVPDKKQNACNCGRIQESLEIKRIKEKIFENFNERIQLRKILMEIQDQNVMNLAQIKKKQNQILALKQEQQQNPDSNSSQELKTLTRNIYTLKLSTQKNLLKKQITNLQLAESMSITKKIREEIPRKIKTKENRQFLEILIKNHILELQNIELEINLQMQDKILGDLRKISGKNREVLDSNGVVLVKLDEEEGEEDIFGVNKDDIELELEEQEDAQNQQDENQPDLEQSIHELNNDVHRNIIEESYEERYDDDFEEVEEKKIPTFDDNHLNEEPEDQNQNERKFLKKQPLKYKKEERGTKNMQVNYSMGNMGAKVHEEIQEKRKNNLNLNGSGNKMEMGVELGVVGFNSITKKREKTMTNEPSLSNPTSTLNKSPTKLGLSIPNNHNPSQKDQPSDTSLPLQFNLKGVNLKLNQKFPMVMGPKQKKKKP